MKTTKIIGLAVFLIVSLVSVSAFCGTTFVGMSRAGVLQLDDNLRIGAINQLGDKVEHLALSGTERLYCALPGKIAVLNAKTLAHIASIDPKGDVIAMEFKGGYLFVLVSPNSYYADLADYPAYPQVKVISDTSFEIVKEIAVGSDPSDMTVNASGSKVFVAKAADSKIEAYSVATGELIEVINCNPEISIPERPASKPSSLALAADNKLYAADTANSEVIVVNIAEISIPENEKILKRIPVGEECVKVCPGGNEIYAIDRGQIPDSSGYRVHVIDTSSDTVTGLMEFENVASDAARHPNGSYTIVGSTAGDIIYKMEQLTITDKRKLPGPLAVLVTDADLATPNVIYSAGTQINRGSEEAPPEQYTPLTGEGSGLDGMELLGLNDPIEVISPNGGEKLCGVQDVFWDNGGNSSGNAYIKCIVNGQTKPLHDGSRENDGWFVWDTTVRPIPPTDSAEYKIKIDVDRTGTIVSDESDLFFLVDNTPPVVNITEPVEEGQSISGTTITVKATATDATAGVRNPLAVKVNNILKGYAYLQASEYVANGVTISNTPVGTRNIIKVIAHDDTDPIGNEGSDEVSAFVGWMTHIELPHSVPYTINNLRVSSGAATSQIILDVMKKGAPGSPTQPPTQDAIFTAGVALNHETWPNELDAYGVDGALDSSTIDPWGATSPYNFGITTYPSGEFNIYLTNIACWLGYTIPNPAVAKHIPAAVPKYGYTLQPIWWVAVTGVAADANPYPTPAGRTIYGMWITDPEQGVHNIGTDTYIVADSLDELLQPAPVQYVSVVEPPEVVPGAIELAPPLVNKSTLALVEIAERFNSASDSFEKHMIDSALVVDMDEARPLVRYSVEGDLLNLFKPPAVTNSPVLCWKDIISPVLLTDEKFRKAMDGALAREFLCVKRLDINEEYILIPFDKFTEGKFLSYAALIVDKETGAFKEGSWVEQPTRYIQISKEEAVAKVAELHPEAASKEISARLVWKPGEMSASPFYPFWEVTAGENKYYVIEK